jgi:hypothetical protein
MSGFTKVCVTVATAASFLASGMAQAEMPSEGCWTAAPVSGIYQTDVGGLTRTWRMQIPSGPIKMLVHTRSLVYRHDAPDAGGHY